MENPLSRGRTRNLEFRYHFVREVAMTEEDLQEGHTNGKRLKFVWAASKDQIAGIFTKILPGNVHYYLSEHWAEGSIF
jgi:hypothetical protein